MKERAATGHRADLIIENIISLGYNQEAQLTAALTACEVTRCKCMTSTTHFFEILLQGALTQHPVAKQCGARCRPLLLVRAS